MLKIVFVLLLLFVGAGATWFALDHNALVAVRGFFAYIGRWIAINLAPLAKLYATRRALAPFWNTVYKIVFIALGVFGLQRLTRRLQSYIRRHAQNAWATWKQVPKSWRWVITASAVFSIGFFGFGILLLPLWIPGLGKFMRSFHFMWVDRFTNKWTRPVRSWYRRFLRQNTIARLVRRPYRIALYHIVTRTERGSRLAHKHVHRLITKERKPA